MNKKFFRSSFIGTVALGVIMITTLIIPMRTNASPAFAGGDGTSGNPYQISDCTMLQAMQNDLSANYQLIQNVDCSATSTWNDNGRGGFNGFLPVGSRSAPFTGTLSGNNSGSSYEIQNLYINSGDGDVGLFAAINGATIDHIAFTGSGSIANTGDQTGILAAFAHNSTISHITSSVSISARDYVGGLIGIADEGTIIDSSSTTGDIAGLTGISGYGVGGLVGELLDATITNSFATGSVLGAQDVGGLVGLAGNDAVIDGSYTQTGTTVGVTYVGGLVGDTSNFANVTITNSHALGAVEGVTMIGGLVGAGRNLTIIDSYAEGDISVNNSAIPWDQTGTFGGLVGWLGESSIIESYSGSQVYGNDNDSYVGGFAGYVEYSDIYNSYAGLSGISGGEYVGGFVGYADHMNAVNDPAGEYVQGGNADDYIGGFVGYASNSYISQSFSMGPVFASFDNAGGFAGSVANTDISDSYELGFVGMTDIDSNYSIGGFIGYLDSGSSVERSYATGNVSGSDDVGGFIGQLGAGSGIVSDSFSTGAVSTNESGTWLGGFIGQISNTFSNTDTISNDFYDLTNSGQTNCLGRQMGVCTGVDTSGGNADYFKNNNTNAPLNNWNFDTIWQTNISDYPSFVSVNLGSQYGDGTPTHPYLISSCSQFEAINSNPSASYKLIQSLDCTGEGNNIMISSSGDGFTGTFDGDHHAMKVTIDDESDYVVGLFQGILGGTIKDFTIAPGSTITGNNVTGSIVGGILGGKLIRVSSYATVTGIETDPSGPMYLGAGGIAGGTQSSEIIGSSFHGSVIAPAFTGGIVGMILDQADPLTSISTSSNTGTIVGSIGLGGIVGFAVDGGTLTDDYSSGTITATGMNMFEGALGAAAGIVGVTQGDLTISRSYSTGTISGDSNDNFPSGGILGTDFGNIATIIDSWSAASITGIPGYLGGILGGYNNSPAFLYNNYYDGFATGLGLGSCVGSNSGQAGDTPGQCQGVDTSDNTYFKNNNTVSPLNNWNFSNTWNTATDYPTLDTYVDGLRAPDQVVFSNYTTSRTDGTDTAQATLDWHTPYAGTAPISDYNIEYRLAGHLDWSTLSHDPSTATEVTLTGLIPGNYYDFWVAGISGDGEGDGGMITFLVGDGNITPVLSVQPATDVTPTSVTLHGTIISTGGANVTEHGFQYGDQVDTFDNSTVIPLTDPVGGDGNGEYQASITGLTCNTTYYYRFYAINEIGPGYSDTDGISFTTAACPILGGGGGVSGGSSLITWTPQTGTVIHQTTSPNTSGIITKALKLGVSNSDVKLLQKFLNNHGYLITSSGPGSLGHETNSFGAKTKTALMKFQKDHGLKPDGIAGSTTRKVINNLP